MKQGLLLRNIYIFQLSRSRFRQRGQQFSSFVLSTSDIRSTILQRSSSYTWLIANCSHCVGNYLFIIENPAMQKVLAVAYVGVRELELEELEELEEEEV